jgi:hypothetical protein
LSNWCSEFEEAAMKAVADGQAAMEASKAEAVRIAAERAEAVKDSARAAVVAKAAEAIKAKVVEAAEALTWADRYMASQWDSVVRQVNEMMDILAECSRGWDDMGHGGQNVKVGLQHAS